MSMKHVGRIYNNICAVVTLVTHRLQNAIFVLLNNWRVMQRRNVNEFILIMFWFIFLNMFQKMINILMVFKKKNVNYLTGTLIKSKGNVSYS